MTSWNQITVQQGRYEELLREAEQHRLVRAARAGQPFRPGPLRRGLVWLGVALVALGSWLQAHAQPTVEGLAVEGR